MSWTWRKQICCEAHWTWAQQFLGMIVATSESIELCFLCCYCWAHQVFNIWMIFCSHLAFFCLFFYLGAWISSAVLFCCLLSDFSTFFPEYKIAVFLYLSPVVQNFREIIQFGCGGFSNERTRAGQSFDYEKDSHNKDVFFLFLLCDAKHHLHKNESTRAMRWWFMKYRAKKPQTEFKEQMHKQANAIFICAWRISPNR